MKFPRNTRIFRGQLEIAPFAAVFFLLMMFLTLSSSLVVTPGIPVTLPAAPDLPGTTNATVIVVIDGGGQLYFQDQILTETTLQQRLSQEVASFPVPPTLVIQADRDVRYENLVRLGLLARQAGLREVVLATRPEPGVSPGLPVPLP